MPYHTIAFRRSPLGLAAAPGGGVLVADTGNCRVVQWSPGAPNGLVVAGGREDDDGWFEPVGVGLDGSGAMLVTSQAYGSM